MSYYQQPKRGSFMSGMFSVAQKGLDTAKGMHETYKQMKQTNGNGQPMASAPPYNPNAQPNVSLDDYPQFTQTVIDAIVLGSKRYFQNMGDNKKYKEIQPILQQIANLPQGILLGQEILPFKPKKGNFFGYKGGITRRKKSRGRKSRKH
jgi:hypothetical protein